MKLSKIIEEQKPQREKALNLTAREMRKLKEIILKADNEALTAICYGNGEEIRTGSRNHAVYLRILQKIQEAKYL